MHTPTHTLTDLDSFSYSCLHGPDKLHKTMPDVTMLCVHVAPTNNYYCIISSRYSSRPVWLSKQTVQTQKCLANLFHSSCGAETLCTGRILLLQRRGRLTQRAASCRNSVSDFRWWRWGELWLEHSNSQSIVRPAHPCRVWWAVWASSALQYTAPVCSTHLCVGKIWLKSDPRSPAVHWFTNCLTVLTATLHFPGGHSHTHTKQSTYTDRRANMNTHKHRRSMRVSVVDPNTHKGAQL